ncbi:3-oxoacyl-ACP reductase FabG [Aquimarina sp. AU58]|uniref:3-oxoacyl-ACP reductase FabG n=1 Tax=Aquimarina sp. AU58 TaxID=1874112 RepID=UPI000D6EA1BF|nr:3-oxoacyl-ACP reductase FabG [Aquimarina sp. AU58]
MKNDLTDKLFLITGGSKGIGKAIVEKFYKSGAKVAFTYNNNQTSAEKIVNTLGNNDSRIKCYKLDVRNYDDIEQLIPEIEEDMGEIYGLVNNAGITKDRAFLRMQPQDWNDVINTNLNGVFNMTKAFGNKAIRRGRGKIINISSVSGLKGSQGQANYASSKAAIISLTKTLAREFASFGVQINAVAPGFIATEMVNAMPELAKKKINTIVPMKRMGESKEVADAVKFLASPSSDYITGHTLVIDGGLTA